jgi:hypothetical protein
MKSSSTHNRLPILLLFLLFVLMVGQARAQSDSSLHKSARDSSLSESTTEGLPILMYDTDVGFGKETTGLYFNFGQMF